MRTPGRRSRTRLRGSGHPVTAQAVGLRAEGAAELAGGLRGALAPIVVVPSRAAVSSAARKSSGFVPCSQPLTTRNAPELRRRGLP